MGLKRVEKVGRINGDGERKLLDGFAWTHRRRERGREQATVRNRDQDFLDSTVSTDLDRFSVELHVGLAAHAIDHLDVSPFDSLGPTGADGLENRFLGRPATRVVLYAGFSRPTISDLAAGEHLFDKRIVVLLNHITDSRTFDDIGTDANNIHS